MSSMSIVLFVTTTLSVYKPWGMTPYGLRKTANQVQMPVHVVSDDGVWKARPNCKDSDEGRCQQLAEGL